MKVEGKVEGNETYVPHSVTITMESAKEAQAFYCLFNHGDIAKFMNETANINVGSIRKCIENNALYGNVDYINIWGEFTKIFEKE